MTHVTREQWLNAGARKILARLFKGCGHEPPERIRVSCGWPGKHTTLGVCWHKDASADGTFEIFITPMMDDPVEVLNVLAHELVHAHLPRGTHHKKPFVQLADAIGLSGSPAHKLAAPGSDAHRALEEIAEKLGGYPHARIVIEGKKLKPLHGGDGDEESEESEEPAPKKNVTLKSVSPGLEKYRCAVRADHLEAFGPPLDPAGAAMVPSR